MIVNPTNWIPIIDGKTGKPSNYVGWDTPEKRIERLKDHIKTLTGFIV